MEREKAIEILNALAWVQGGPNREETITAISMAIEALQVEDEWIPASKRLPDIDIPVLVSDGVYVWEDELQEDYEDGQTVYWWDSQCSFDFNDTAWMPKPKPYKGGGNE